MNLFSWFSNNKTSMADLIAIVADAEMCCKYFAAMTNIEFVGFVRKTETDRPEFVNLVVWSNGVERELKIRLLLKLV